ncbi:MAG: type II toxin-antitoxin system HicB family antitoxin [Tepidisphaeraceae bacterium]
MKQCFHTIIKPRSDGWFVGWVEEMPGTVTRARSLDECRAKLRESLQIMIETHRSEARMFMDRTCLQEMLEVESDEANDAIVFH